MFATRFSTGMTLAIGLVSIGCSSSSDTDVLTYDEFKAQAYQEPDTGIYIVNGDEPVETEEQMKQMYEAFLDSAARADDPTYASTEQASISIAARTAQTINGLRSRPRTSRIA